MFGRFFGHRVTERALAYDTLTPERLSLYFNDRAITPQSCAHLCIDVQNIYAHPRKTARYIANTATPAFRAASVPNYWVRLGSIGHSCAEMDFAYVQPEAHEIQIMKEDTSAFKGTDLRKTLKRDGIKTVVLTGFDFNACVKDTALDAVKRYNTIILTDCTNFRAERNGTKATLQNAGVAFARSKDFFKALGY